MSASPDSWGARSGGWTGRWRAALAALGALGAAGLITAPAASAATEVKEVAFTTQGCQTWTVPIHVASSVSVHAVGGAGQSGGNGPFKATGGAGGAGDGVAAVLAAHEGETLDVCVDADGGAGASKAGGAGGGASGVARGTDFSAPLVIAAGGGGGGGSTVVLSPVFEEYSGTAGGNAGSPGTDDARSGKHGGAVEGGSKTSSGGPGSGGAGEEGPVVAGVGAGGGGGGGGGGFVGGGGGQWEAGGAGGTDRCSGERISGCTTTPRVGTSSSSGPGTGEAKVVVTYTAETISPPWVLNLDKDENPSGFSLIANGTEMYGHMTELKVTAGKATEACGESSTLIEGHMLKNHSTKDEIVYPFGPYIDGFCAGNLKLQKTEPMREYLDWLGIGGVSASKGATVSLSATENTKHIYPATFAASLAKPFVFELEEETTGGHISLCAYTATKLAGSHNPEAGAEAATVKGTFKRFTPEPTTCPKSVAVTMVWKMTVPSDAFNPLVYGFFAKA